MTAVVVPLEALAPREGVAVTVEAPDLEILLVDWLNAIIYEMATRRVLFRDFRVEIADGSLRGETRGWRARPLQRFFPDARLGLVHDVSHDACP